MSVDALRDFEPRNQGLFLKIRSDEPVTLRVLTLDPIVANDKWGNTRYSFVVWNWNEGRAQILQKGGGILKQFTAIHRDDDFDDLNKIDVKITATGEGLETRYSVMPLSKTKDMTSEMLAEAKEIDLPKLVPNGIRLSQYNAGEDVPEGPTDEDESEAEAAAVNSGYETAKRIRDSLGPKDEEENDLSSIPF